MAGVKGRSGRRAFIETPEGFSLPEIGETEDSVRVFLASVARAVAKRELDPRTADSLIKAGTGALSALKQKHARLEMNELNEMLAEARKVAQAGRAHEVADRLTTPDGEGSGGQ